MDKPLATLLLVMATDVDAVYLGWGTSGARSIVRTHPQALLAHRDEVPAGSMLPKVEARAGSPPPAAGRPSGR